jgi:hypothetical protein
MSWLERTLPLNFGIFMGFRSTVVVLAGGLLAEGNVEWDQPTPHVSLTVFDNDSHQPEQPGSEQ